MFNNYEIGVLNYRFDTQQRLLNQNYDILLSIKTYTESNLFLTKLKPCINKPKSEVENFYTRIISIQTKSEIIIIDNLSLDITYFGLYKSQFIEVFIIIQKYESSNQKLGSYIHPLLKLDLKCHVVNTITAKIIYVGKTSNLILVLNNPDFNLDIIVIEFKVEGLLIKSNKTISKPKETLMSNVMIKYFDNIQYDSQNLSFTYKFNNESRINFQDISVNSFLELFVLNNEIYLIVSKLNIVFLYIFKQFEFNLVKQINFLKLEGSIIAHTFFTNSGEIYAFNRFSEYSKENIYLNSNQISNNNDINSLQLSNEILGMQQMKYGFGFFILSVKNIIKLSDLILEVFLINQQNIKSISEHFIEITKYDQIILPYLNEYIFLEKKGILKIADRFLKNGDQVNTRNSIIVNKLLYIQSIVNSDKNKQKYYKNIIIDELRTIFSNLNIKENSQVCDFCSKKLINVNENNNSMLCEDNHENFICCLSRKKISENNAECELCSLFYDKKCLDECKILPYYICYICQSELYF